jgi:hypothetical protein
VRRGVEAESRLDLRAQAFLEGRDLDQVVDRGVGGRDLAAAVAASRESMTAALASMAVMQVEASRPRPLPPYRMSCTPSRSASLLWKRSVRKRHISS